MGAVPVGWSAIPGTRKIVTLAEKLIRETGLEPKVLLGAAASEEALSQMRNPRLLLFSTHGYFMDHVPRVWLDVQSGNINPDFWEGGNPLHRSMLILAGANQRHDRIVGYRIGKEILSEAEATKRGIAQDMLEENRFELGDGLLTAYEILGLDLRNTELVMLTACESGLGVVQLGDGGKPVGIRQSPGEVLAGLRQALQVAGTRSIIMSMWAVPLQPTIDQMQSFLRFWLKDNLTRYLAFHKGQLAALEKARKTKASGHPFWWSGFVYIGDPGEQDM
jgi:CHAT domain-containing protein